LKESQAKQVTLDAITATLNFYSDTFPAWECRSTERINTMKKDLKALAKEGETASTTNPAYWLTVSECDELIQFFDEQGLFYLMERLYNIGFARGMRFESNRRKRKRKTIYQNK